MPHRKDVYITDLPGRVVGGFKPAKGMGRGWVAVDYATPDFRGVGLATGHNSGAPELTIRLDMKGSWVLYLALGCGDAVRAWLDGEKGFREFHCQHGGWCLQEVRLHSANLTGRRLHIAPVHASRFATGDEHCFLGYIRAVPSDHAPKKSARNLVATNDGYSWIALEGMESIRDVTKQFQPYRDSDFFRMLWNPTGADVSGNHLSKAGTTMPFDLTHAYRRCDWEFKRTTRRILKGGGDILKAAVAAARDVGMEIHFYIRPEAFFAPFPYDEVFTSRFLLKNPQWRCRDEFGREIMRMSYAFPQVQDHMLDYIQELLGYGPDGICFAFNRSLPMMICEELVLQAFEARHGRAPRLPEEVDSAEMLEVRHFLLAHFIERLHGLLARRNKVFSAIVEFDNDYSRLMGLDVEGLVGRGLVESLYVTGYCPHSSFWKKVRKTGKVKVYSSIHYVHSKGTEARDPYNHQWQAGALKKILAAGFNGAFYWDTDSMHSNPYNWHVLRHGGSRKFLERVIARDPAAAPVFRQITEVKGARRDRYDPMRSY